MKKLHEGRFASPSDGDMRCLKRVNATLQSFRDISRGLPASYAQAFLAVAMHPGRSVVDYARHLEMLPPVCSRILLEIGSKTRSGDQGFGLIDSQRDHLDLRVHRYFLTPAGRKLAGDVVGHFDAGPVHRL